MKISAKAEYACLAVIELAKPGANGLLKRVREIAEVQGIPENAEAVVAEFRRRTGGRPMDLITSDEHRPYREAVLQAYGVEATTTPSGHPVRAPHRVAPPGLCDATVHKPRRLGRVAEVVIRLVFGTAARLARALSASRVSRAVNVAFLERQHLTDRPSSARKRGGPTASPSGGSRPRRRRTSASIATTSAGWCGRSGRDRRTITGSDGPRRWRRA